MLVEVSKMDLSCGDQYLQARIGQPNPLDLAIAWTGDPLDVAHFLEKVDQARGAAGRTTWGRCSGPRLAAHRESPGRSFPSNLGLTPDLTVV